MDPKAEEVAEGQDSSTPSSMAGKRKTKRVHADGTVSWELAASAGDVEGDEDDDFEDAALSTSLESGGAPVGKHLIDLKEQLTSPKFNPDDPAFFKKMANGTELTMSYLQKEGLCKPILVQDKEGLDLKIPNASSFGIAEVRSSVGSRRLLDVMNVNTQKNFSMTLKEWHKYYDTPPSERKDLYNVISLEFSHTKLDNQILAPKIVRQIDWIDKVWPRHLKEMQVESTNSLDDMMYPKVQKYCLMSVQGCWTDFHIDLGGTSVWYHVLKGKKVFFLIAPTDDNLRRYEEWVLSGKQSQTFFGHLVDKCVRIELEAGNTFFIPSGWIHGVYTPEDSLVFGGNFLHSFGIEKQLQVAHIEEVTRVPQKFRFPFFTEMLWYLLDRYIHVLFGRTHLDLPEEEKRRLRLEKGENIDPNKEFLKMAGITPGDDSGLMGNGGYPGQGKNRPHVHLSPTELRGIKYVVMYLHHLPASKKNVPLMLPDPISVIKDIRELVLTHKDDCPEKAVTGKYVLRWTENDDVDNLKRPRKSLPKMLASGGAAELRKKEAKAASGVSGTGNPRGRPPGSTSDKSPMNTPKKMVQVGGNRRRRVRCKACDACLGGDCKQCQYCKDMTKYGGQGRMKQTCEKRRCLHPQLPVCAVCSECKLDGWYKEPKVQGKESDRPEQSPELYECVVCLDIVHPKCAKAMGRINNDLSNSWECAKCVSSGYGTVPSRQKRNYSGEIVDGVGGTEDDPASSDSKKQRTGP